ncbi:6-phosphofructokinase [Enterococcus faecium]|nr:6-phosphofructokinase [Enterococcus hirae]ROX59714.1 6-phosphofructokinase [Enterococcus faecium]ROX60735.1 6-phosphofructokinase [Enterococcus faecium]
MSFSDIAAIIEGIYYGQADEEIFSIQDLLEFLNKNKDNFVVLTDYEEDTANEKL